MPGPIFLDGETVEIRPIEEEDLDALLPMVNNPKIRTMVSVDVPTTSRQQQQWYDNVVADEENGVQFAITFNSTVVGTIWLHFESKGHPEAELTIFVAEDYWGQGIASEASSLVVDYAFRELGKHRIEASVYDINEASKRLWEKVGFTHEAIHEECAYIDGEYVDVHIYRILEREWFDRVAES